MDQHLSVVNLSTGYAGRPILQGVNFGPIPPGCVVALVGPNAAGKSTLIKALAGLLPAQANVTLAGQTLGPWSERDRLRHVAYLPQALPQPTSLLAYEVWQSALRASRPEWRPAHRQAAIESVVTEMGLAPLALRRMDQLSGGQRQMVALAQVIVRAPKLLLLDEPTSALDLRWQLLALQRIGALAERTGTICVVALHDLTLALRNCHHVLALADGRLQASGTPGDVLTPDLIRRLYGIEARIERCSRGTPMLIVDGASALSSESTIPPPQDTIP